MPGSRASKQAQRDMDKMRAKYGEHYVGYHESLAKGEKTTKRQRDAYNTHRQSQGKKNAARRR